MEKIHIVIQKPKRKNGKNIVRLKVDAYDALAYLSDETGVPIGTLASAIITGAIDGNMIVFDTEQDDD